MISADGSDGVERLRTISFALSYRIVKPSLPLWFPLQFEIIIMDFGSYRPPSSPDHLSHEHRRGFRSQFIRRGDLHNCPIFKHDNSIRKI